MPKFTKQHYEIIAKIIRESGMTSEDCPDDIAINNFLLAIEATFQKDNPNFNIEKFEKAFRPHLAYIQPYNPKWGARLNPNE